MHDGPEGHYHYEGDPLAGYDDVILWNTAGFDVGSSTSQIVFSRITLARDDAKYVVTQRDILHESDVILTPYRSQEVIDGERLAAFVSRQFAAANLTKDDIDAGAVILTGLALSTQNSRAIANAIADDAGKFVAVSAGDTLEARLAANGAGVAHLSQATDGVVVHVDVGGGTTKLSAWRKGRLLGLAAIDVGARLVTFDADGRITRIDPQWAGIVASLDCGGVRVGEKPTPARIADFCAEIAEEVLRQAGISPQPARWPHLLRTAALFEGKRQPIAAVVFSGGVSEYVYRRESRTFGDIGLPLGTALRDGCGRHAVELIPLERGIRATVLGVSQHSMQLSGNTVYVSDPSILPLRNIPVLLPDLDLSAGELDAAPLRRSLVEVFDECGITAAPSSLAIAIKWRGSATYRRLNVLARALLAELLPKLRANDPVVIIADGDVAGVLGSQLNEELAGERGVVCVDAIDVHEFDHIDIGQFAPRTKALPIIVKTLLFAHDR